MLVLIPPHRLGELRGRGAVPCHLAYCVGPGPHLLRTGLPAALRGGVMAVAAQGDLLGEGTDAFCREVLRECAVRNFRGVLCDWEQPAAPFWCRLVQDMEDALLSRGLALYVPEECGACTRQAGVLISTAICAGSLALRMREAAERFGPHRLTAALQRSAEDLTLPAPEGVGKTLSARELEELLHRTGAVVYFSPELCARYFTYGDEKGRTHFVLFDDGDTMARKVETARGAGVRRFLAAWPEIWDIAPRLGLGRTGSGQPLHSGGK